MAAAAILVFGFHFRYSTMRFYIGRRTLPENFIEIGQLVQQLWHLFLRFAHNGNSLFPPEFWGFWGKWPPKIMFTLIFIPEGSSMPQTALNEPLTTKIVRCFRVDIGIEDKRKETQKPPPKVYISPYCPDEPHKPISTKLGLVAHIREAGKFAKILCWLDKGCASLRGAKLRVSPLKREWPITHWIALPCMHVI